MHVYMCTHTHTIIYILLAYSKLQIFKMGNCIGSACALPKKVRPYVDDDQELTASARSGGPETAELCGGALLKSGELQPESCQRMKIVVNKKQLQLLISSLEELESRNIVIQSIGRRARARKWRPSLAAIPEL